MKWSLLVNDNATVQDTVNLIRDTINAYSESPFVVNLTAKLQSKYKTVDEFTRALFIYADKSVKYQRDQPGHERVTTPKRLIQDGVGDCKKFTVLIGAVLKKAGFNPLLKVVSYDGESYAHIYIILPIGNGKKYITLDPVNKHLYNKEVDYIKATVHNLQGNDMKLSLLGRPANAPIDLSSALSTMTVREQDKSLAAVTDDLLGDMSEISGCDTLRGADFAIESLSGAEQDELKMLMGFADDSLSGEEMILGAPYVDLGALGKRKKRKSKIWNFIKKIGLAPVRASFLLLVRINLFGLASKMKQGLAKGAKILQLWKKLGGKADKLKKAILKGAAIREKRLAKKKAKGIKGADDLSLAEADSILGALGAAPLAAVLAAAVPVVTAVLTVLKKSGVMKKGDKDSEVLAKNADAAEQNLEKKIETGQANQVVNQVQTSYQAAQQRAAAAPAVSEQPQYASSYESDQEKVYDENGNEISGLGSWADILNAVTKVVKVAAPTIKTAATAVKAVQQAAAKSKNPAIKQVAVNSELALRQVVNAANPQQKAAAASALKKNLMASQVLIQTNALQKRTAPAAGSFFCWSLNTPAEAAGVIVKTGLLIGYTISQITNYINF